MRSCPNLLRLRAAVQAGTGNLHHTPLRSGMQTETPCTMPAKVSAAAAGLSSGFSSFWMLCLESSDTRRLRSLVITMCSARTTIWRMQLILAGDSFSTADRSDSPNARQLSLLIIQSESVFILTIQKTQNLQQQQMIKTCAWTVPRKTAACPTIADMR